MKRYSLLLTLLLSCPIYGYINNKQEVDMNELNPINSQTRSFIYKPVVYIDTEVQQLSITFLATEKNCSVYILNDFEIIVYQSFFLGDGTENTYDLSNLNTGNYKIVIESQKSSYEGVMSL